jgi:hypothetical protein
MTIYSWTRYLTAQPADVAQDTQGQGRADQQRGGPAGTGWSRQATTHMPADLLLAAAAAAQLAATWALRYSRRPYCQRYLHHHQLLSRHHGGKSKRCTARRGSQGASAGSYVTSYVQPIVGTGGKAKRMFPAAAGGAWCGSCFQGHCPWSCHSCWQWPVMPVLAYPPLAASIGAPGAVTAPTVGVVVVVVLLVPAVFAWLAAKGLMHMMGVMCRVCCCCFYVETADDRL